MGIHGQRAKEGRACCPSGRDRVGRSECQPRPDRRVVAPPASTDRVPIMATQEVDDPVGGPGPKCVAPRRRSSSAPDHRFPAGPRRSHSVRRRDRFRWFVVVAGRKVRVLAIESLDGLVGAESIALPGRRGGNGLPGARIVGRHGLRLDPVALQPVDQSSTADRLTQRHRRGGRQGEGGNSLGLAGATSQSSGSSSVPTRASDVSCSGTS